MGVWYITSYTILMKNKITFSLIITALVLSLSSCCVLMPTARTSTIGVTVTPSNATIKGSSGTVLGTGSCDLDFDCKDDKGDYYSITISAPDYKTITERIYNTREDYSRHFTLRKLHHTKVTLNVEPSNASIYYNSGSLAGVGTCTFDFTEEDSNNRFYEVTITAPYYNDQVVRVYKNDGVKKVSLTRKPIKTIVVTPGDADIAINNEKVAKGKYDVNFERTDKVLITLSREGYETATYTLLKSDPRQTVTYEMDVDEAYENSEGGDDAAQYANKWVPLKPSKDIPEDQVWRRLFATVTGYGDKDIAFEVERADKTVGWIKTFPTILQYKASDVRTTLEIQPDYSTGEKDQFKVRLYFEKRQKNTGEEGWVKYDRLMKVYKDLIPTLKNSIGGM